MLNKLTDPVITIEPDTADNLRSIIICAWHGSDLAFEIDPIMALFNLSYLFERDYDYWDEDFESSNIRAYTPKFLSPLDLLRHKIFAVKEGCAVFKAPSAAWLLCSAGLTPADMVNIARTSLDYGRLKLNEGVVVIEVL